MTRQITYGVLEDSDFESLLEMGHKLWTDFEIEKLKKQLLGICQSSRQRVWMAKTSRDGCIGFSIFSIRTDYVEGAEKSPTGYLEGIFVESEFRKMGIAREFIRIGEGWCKEEGCTQMGSDTWLSDRASRDFHKKMGFWEEDELVHFLKDIE